MQFMLTTGWAGEEAHAKVQSQWKSVISANLAKGRFARFQNPFQREPK
jgi:hypothetical protein